MRIRSFTAADIHGLDGWFADEAALIQWGGGDMRFPLDRPQLEAMLAEAEGKPPRRWLFCGTEEQEIVAHAQVALDWRHGVGRLGRVAIHPARRGQRLAAPFLDAVIGRLFALPEIERIELNVYTFNAAAISTYRRLGFVAEGVRRSSVQVGGERWDIADFGLLRSDSRLPLPDDTLWSSADAGLPTASAVTSE